MAGVVELNEVNFVELIALTNSISEERSKRKTRTREEKGGVRSSAGLEGVVL